VAHHPEAVDDLVAKLKAGGHRTTTARRAVLEAILEAGDGHLTADEVAEMTHREHPDIHLSTVYRTLDSLCEAGLLSPARFADRPGTYHLADDHHHHAVCSRCGTVLLLADDVFAAVTVRLAEEHGFHAEPTHITIPGLCATCNSATEA
jgi:Fe2+ or Zn2+ uptake regulation protein